MPRPNSISLPLFPRAEHQQAAVNGKERERKKVDNNYHSLYALNPEAKQGIDICCLMVSTN